MRQADCARETTIDIRQAELADTAALVHLNHAVQALHIAQRPDHFRTPTDREVADQLGSVLQDGDSMIWLAVAGKTGVGYLLARVFERPQNVYQRQRRICEIEQIVVAPEARRLGVGRRLLDQAVAYGEKHGVDAWELTSWAFNTDAHHAFRAAGFAPMKMRFERTVHAAEPQE